VADAIKKRDHEMDKGVNATAFAIVLCLVVLAGCSTPGPLFGAKSNGAIASDTTGSVAPSPAADKPGAAPAKSVHAAPPTDLQLGQKYFAAKNYELAEQSFRAAADKNPANAAAWIGLATCYDRLHRFELADEAYRKATAIAGETAEILNDEGYSYILRGDYPRAKAKL
jgi:Flp pilus assembly protein TadD